VPNVCSTSLMRYGAISSSATRFSIPRSLERMALLRASKAVLPKASAYPMLFICVPNALQPNGNFSNSKRGTFTAQ